MAQAIFCFLLSIVVSLGGSVTADNIGQDFAAIYSNQDPSVQAKMDEYFLGNPGSQLMQDLTFQSIKLSTEMLYDIQQCQVSNEVIQESIGIDSWKNFVEQNKNYADLDSGYYIKARFIDTDDYIGHALTLFDKDGNSIFQLAGHGTTADHSHYTEDDKNFYRSTRYENLTINKENGKYCVDMYFADDAVHWLIEGTCPYLVESNIDDHIGSISNVAIAGSEIGSIPINSDGSIILPDGTRVYPNADGSYTIGDITYYPTYSLQPYDDSALLSLLNQILQKLNDLTLDSELEYEEEGDTTISEELEQAQDDAIEEVKSSDIALSQYTYASPKWTTIFPFCIPWDFVRGVKLLSSSPTAPKFSIPFEIPAFGQFPGYSTEITLDFSDYDKYFVPVRWFSTIFFLIGLGFITFKIVKGAA